MRLMRGDESQREMRGGPRKKGEGAGTRVGLLLPERARLECARSTAAVRPDTGAGPEETKCAGLEEGMEADDRVCSRNARSRTLLVGRAQWKINQPPSLKRKLPSLEGRGSLVVLLLAERARSECARSTRALEDQPGCPRKR